MKLKRHTLRRFAGLRQAHAAGRAARLNALPPEAPLSARVGLPVQHHDAVRFQAPINPQPSTINQG